jgi:predicted double-glycine peptidase
MRIFVRLALPILILLCVLVPRGYSGSPVVSDWDVAGLHDGEGAYTGTAHLELDGLAVKMRVSATTATGKPLEWSARGKLEAGEIQLTLEPGFTVPGATASQTKGKAAFVLGDDGSLSGYWHVATSAKALKGPGGTETLTVKSGAPLDATTTGPLPSLPADALAVPMVTQPDEYSCGASSLQAILYYYRVSDGDLKSLYKPLGTSAANGTDPPQIVDFARSKGLTANYVETVTTLDDLRSSLKARDPVMLVIQAWRSTETPWKDDGDDAHWVVLVGMDATYAYFMDPWAHFGLGYMPISELLERWHCAEPKGRGFTTVEHETIFFHGLAPARRDALVRMR